MNVAAIVIGRNEGERLKLCLASVVPLVDRTIYVDSGSTDGSCAVARSAGAEVVQLDLSSPFTAARARNAGLEALGEGGAPAYIQFVDGDCELSVGWLECGSAFLGSNSDVGVVFGRLRERFPDVSVYNRLCDREWNTPAGRSRSCGGNALIRSSAIAQVGGYNSALVAGEEPELCIRLRAKGWQVWRLDADMALHDAAMLRFSQWWKRARRSGYAAAQGMTMHGGPPEYHGLATVLRAVCWGGVLPIVSLVSMIVMPLWGWLLLLAYPIQIARMSLGEGGNGNSWQYACFMMLGKFAELYGVVQYIVARPGESSFDYKTIAIEGD